MSTAVTVTRMSGASPRFVARMTGLFYLLTIVAGGFAQGFVSNRLVVSGDASITATNILAHKSLFQWGFTVYLIEMACQIVFIALFYELLKPANKSISLIAAFLGLAGCAIKTVSRLFYIAPLLIVEGRPYLSVLDDQQRHALALLFLQINDHGAGMALAFFGLYALLTG